MNSVTAVWRKYKELILYGFFGAGATLINILSFAFFRNILCWELIRANVIAWVLAFIFAFVTNKQFVFGSRSWKGTQTVKEFLEFLTARLFTLFLDSFLLWLMVEKLLIGDIVSKIIVNIIVIIVNYVASKFIIFRKK